MLFRWRLYLMHSILYLVAERSKVLFFVSLDRWITFHILLSFLQFLSTFVNSDNSNNVSIKWPVLLFLSSTCHSLWHGQFVKILIVVAIISVLESLDYLDPLGVWIEFLVWFKVESKLKAHRNHHSLKSKTQYYGILPNLFNPRVNHVVVLKSNLRLSIFCLVSMVRAGILWMGEMVIFVKGSYFHWQEGDGAILKGIWW